MAIAISVVMPVYNAMPFLPEAVESILSQTWKDFEFIIIDDGSTDDGPDYLDSVKDTRIRFVRGLENQGCTRRITQGIHLSIGSFIARQDADDISNPNRLADQVNLLVINPALSAVCGAFSQIDQFGQIVSTVSPPTNPQLLREMLFYTNPVCHGCMMVRRSALEAAGGYDPTFEPAEDYELWLRLVEYGPIGSLPDVLYQLRLHPTSVSGKRRSEQRFKANQARLKAYSRVDPLSLRSQTRTLYHFAAALYQISTDRRIAAIAELEDAFQEESSSDDHVMNEMIRMAVSQAMELGMSNHAIPGSAPDKDSGDLFFQTLIDCLPREMPPGFVKELRAEYHAAYAYVLAGQGRQWSALVRLMRSWRSSRRHWRNLGMLKRLFMQRSLLPRLSP